MECPKDVQWYTAILQEERVYVFLDGLDDQLDQVKSTVLQMQPFPTIEQAYMCIRREMVLQTVMGNSSDEGMGIGLASKELKTGPNPFGKYEVLVLNKSNPTSPNSKQRTEGLMCSHYGNSKHTQDTCFKLHGYPDWGHELQAKKKRNGTNIEPSTDKMVVAATNPICL